MLSNDDGPGPPPIAPCLSPVDCASTSGECVEVDVELLMGRGHVSDGCQCCLTAASEAGQDVFAQCLIPVLPPVDFCVDPGNAENNPNGTLGECMHEWTDF